MPSTDRKPLQPLPLLPFLVASSSSSSSSPRKNKRALPALKDRDMSLPPSPFAASTSTTPRTAQGPLATLYDVPSPRRLDASSSLLASPSRAMMDDDDAQNRAEDELPTSSPRRLLDAFLHSASPGKARRGGSMLPPQSPRRGAVVQKAEEEFMPTSAAAAFFSPSLALSLSASGGAGAGASSFFAEAGPTSFASASIGGAEGGFGGLLPAFEAGVRGKKRESLEEAGAAGVKRARREGDE
ncbi:hypothetical protein JCM10450v2_000209 [Rhodotorula kratochvilovae]